MDLEESIDVDAPRSDVVAVLGDLASYAEWLDIVAMARPVAGTVDDPGGGPAWEVELRARIRARSSTASASLAGSKAGSTPRVQPASRQK